MGGILLSDPRSLLLLFGSCGVLIRPQGTLVLISGCCVLATLSVGVWHSHILDCTPG